MLGPGCKIIGGNHNLEYTEAHMYHNQDASHMQARIIIEDGAWIGANTVILSGAHISEGAVIGAMSLVNKYVPPYCIAVGIPATHLKRRFSDPTCLHKLLNNVGSEYTIEKIESIYSKYKL